MVASPAVNAVLQDVLTGQYAAGWARYEAMPQPTAEDHRWAALCLMHEGRLLDAKRLLAHAIADGCHAARIELATLHRSLGDKHLARATLNELHLQDLAPLDQALAQREAGVQAFQRGELLAATNALEQAWLAATSSRFGPAVLAPVAQVLGMVCAERGLDQRASNYFTFAAEHAHAARLAYVLASHGLNLVYLGQHDAAEHLFQKADAQFGGATPPAAAILRYNEALLARARREYALAAELFTNAIGLARTHGDAETECYAELWLGALATTTEDYLTARKHLARAQQLSVGQKTDALVALRTGALHLRTQQGGLEHLRRAAHTCAALTLRREEGWAWLHLSEAYLRLGHDRDAEQALEHAADARHAVNSPALAIEMDQLSAVRQHLRGGHCPYAAVLLDDERLLTRAAPDVLKLETLGTARLTLNGKPLRLDLARGPEVLAYLLAYPQVRLEQIQLALFPDIPHKRSKSYIHQVRAELQRVAPGLLIPFNPVGKTYNVQLQNGLTLTWDIQEVISALNHPDPQEVLSGLSVHRGPFLPKAESEWAQAKREEVRGAIIGTGRDLLDRWAAHEERQHYLRLAQALHDIDPNDEQLSEALIHATLTVDGANAAQRTWRVLCARFEAELGEVPPGLQAIRHVLKIPTSSRA